MHPLDVRLCWPLGSIPARSIDEPAVESLVKREGLPAWVVIEGVVYMRVQGTAARVARERDERTPRIKGEPTC